tara:strand:+ start:11259 stop:11459 length:201 start_codon:yes stop_codon:yes gene_type:complete
MKLEYSYIDSKSNPEYIPDEGLGIYTGIIHKSWKKDYIKPDAVEYMKNFYASEQIPGYTRVGNNSC